MLKIKYSRLFYPGFLGIKEGSSFQIYDSKLLLGSLTLLKHHTALEFIDLNSKIQSGEQDGITEYSYNIPINKTEGALVDKASLDKVNFDIEKILPNHNIDNLAIVFELNPLPRVCRNIHVSELLISREFKEGDLKNDNSIEANILEIFISKYREITKDINIKVPSKSNWNMFGIIMSQINELEDETREQKIELKNLNSDVLSFDIRDYRKISRPTFDFDKITNQLSSELLKGNEVDDFLRLVNIVVEEINIYTNFKYALLETFIFCENCVTGYLRKKKIEKGISGKKIDEMEIAFSYLLNIELPLFLDKYDDNWKEIIGNVNWVRKKRNDVVHSGENVTKEEAIKALESIEKLVIKIKNVS